MKFVIQFPRKEGPSGEATLDPKEKHIVVVVAQADTGCELHLTVDFDDVSHGNTAKALEEMLYDLGQQGWYIMAVRQ